MSDELRPIGLLESAQRFFKGQFPCDCQMDGALGPLKKANAKLAFKRLYLLR